MACAYSCITCICKATVGSSPTFILGSAGRRKSLGVGAHSCLTILGGRAVGRRRARAPIGNCLTHACLAYPIAIRTLASVVGVVAGVAWVERGAGLEVNLISAVPLEAVIDGAVVRRGAGRGEGDGGLDIRGDGLDTLEREGGAVNGVARLTISGEGVEGVDPKDHHKCEQRSFHLIITIRRGKQLEREVMCDKRTSWSG